MKHQVCIQMIRQSLDKKESMKSKNTALRKFAKQNQ